MPLPSFETLQYLHYYDRAKNVFGDFWCQIGDLGPDFERSKVQAVIDISTTKPLTPHGLLQASRCNSLKAECGRLAEMLDAGEPAEPQLC